MSTDLSTALEARYGEPTAAAPGNAVIAHLLSHASVRHYLATPLPEGTVELIAAAASSAATSSNLQTWSVVAVSNPETRAELARIAGGQKHIIDAPLIFVWIADLNRAATVTPPEGGTTEALDYLEAFLLGSVDAMLAAQNAVVAAESLGLGTVYIGALRNDPEAVAKLLGLPPRCYAVAGLVVGYPDPEKPASIKPRLPQEAVLHRERYNPDQAAAVARHDEATLAFRASQDLPPQTWSRLLTGRLGALKGLGGRHVLREALERLGLNFR